MSVWEIRTTSWGGVEFLTQVREREGIAGAATSWRREQAKGGVEKRKLCKGKGAGFIIVLANPVPTKVQHVERAGGAKSRYVV